MNPNNYQVKDDPLTNQNPQQPAYNANVYTPPVPYQPNPSPQPQYHQEGEMIPIYPVNVGPNNFPQQVGYNGQPFTYNPNQPQLYPPQYMPVNNYGQPVMAVQDTFVIQTDHLGNQHQTHYHNIQLNRNVALIYGRNSVQITCPYCHKEGMTKVKEKTDKASIVAFVIMSICCICCLCLLCTDAIKTFDHECSHCDKFIASSRQMGYSKNNRYKANKHHHH
jgi:hypothetical protein